MANLWADKHQKASKKDRDSNYEECIQVQSLDAEKKGTIMQTLETVSTLTDRKVFLTKEYFNDQTNAVCISWLT